MLESEGHKLLKQQAKRELKKAGFKNEEIHEEHWLDDRKYRIDVIGENENKSVAYECGNTTIDKLKDLRGYFDRVVWLPYIFSKRNSGVHRKKGELRKRYRKSIASGVLRIPSAIRREILKNDNIIMHEHTSCTMGGSMAIYPADESKQKVIRSLQGIIRDLKRGVEEDAGKVLEQRAERKLKE